MRTELFHLENVYRQTNSLVIKTNYLIARKDYKSLCDSKRKEYTLKVVSEFKIVKNSKDFWKLVRNCRLKNLSVDKSLPVNDGINHFSSLLNPSLKANRILHAEPYVSDQLLDS